MAKVLEYMSLSVAKRRDEIKRIKEQYVLILTGCVWYTS